MRPFSIRLRLTAWYSTVLLLGLALFGGGLWVALEHRLLAGVDSRLDQRVEGLQTVLDVEGATGDRQQLQEELSEFVRAIPEGSLIELRDAGGNLLLGGADPRRAAPPQLASDRPLYTTEIRDGKRFRVEQRQIRYGAERFDVRALSSLEDLDTVMRDLRGLLLLMIPGVLAVACLGGYWISRRALAPVDEITRVASSISVQNLSRRLPLARTGDEIERMSEAWNDVLERLEGAVGRIRQFTADSSHELRTPLALISATAELALRRERSSAEYRKSLIDIQSEAGRMTELIEALLTLARADEGSALPLAATDLNQMVCDIVEQSQPAALARGIAMRAEVIEQPAIAPANAAALRRLLLILIDNALKHTPAGGSITVSSAPGPSEVRLRVEDTGEGIEPHVLPHVFERFYRADTARGSGNGTGLGLSIAQAIAHAHGSQVTVRSQPGAGARFELTLRRSS